MSKRSSAPLESPTIGPLRHLVSTLGTCSTLSAFSTVSTVSTVQCAGAVVLACRERRTGAAPSGSRAGSTRAHSRAGRSARGAPSSSPTGAQPIDGRPRPVASCVQRGMLCLAHVPMPHFHRRKSARDSRTRDWLTPTDRECPCMNDALMSSARKHPQNAR